MAEYSAPMKRLIREWAARAHEAEMRLALAPLAEACKRWEQGSLDSFELNNLIHKFHQEDSRDLYLRYATNDQAPALARAIATGAINRATVPTELLKELRRLLQYFEEVATES